MKHPLLDVASVTGRDYDLPLATSKWPEVDRDMVKNAQLVKDKSRNDAAEPRKHATMQRGDRLGFTFADELRSGAGREKQKSSERLAR